MHQESVKSRTANEQLQTELTLENFLLKVHREANQEFHRKCKTTLKPYQTFEYLLLGKALLSYHFSCL